MEKKNGGKGVYGYLAAFAVMAFFAILAFIAIPKAGSGVENSVDMASIVNSITIYSNGMAFVSSSGNAEVPSAGKVHLRVANFTESAILDTLRLEDPYGEIYWVKRYFEEKNVSEKNERYLTFDELLNQSYGKEVSVKLENGEAFGKLLWVSEGKVGIDTNDGLLIVNGGLNSIKLALAETKKTDEKNSTVYERGLEAYMGTERTGAHSLLFSYITSGANWQPNYNLEMLGAKSGTAKLTAFGEVSNNAGEDWRNAVLKLAVGQPNFARNGISGYYNYDFSDSARKNLEMQSAGVAPLAAPVFEGAEVGTQYIYTLSEPVTILKNERANLKVFESSLQYDKENVWESYGSVWQNINLKNTAGKPIAAGIIKVFEAGAFVGEGYAQYTGEGKEAHIGYAVLSQVEVKKETNQTTDKPFPDRRETVYTVLMTVENSLKENVPLTLRDRMAYADKLELIKSSVPASQLSDNRLEWKVDVPAEGKLEITYSYKATNFERAYYGVQTTVAYPAEASK